MSKENTATAKKPVVRRTQEQIVADLKAKAAAAEAKLQAKQRKGFDALTAQYLKALDGVVESLSKAQIMHDQLAEQARGLGIETDRFNDTTVWFVTPDGDDYNLVDYAEQVKVEKTEAQD